MEINQVSAVLAHELRNPLAGIVTHLDCLREMFDPDDPRLENLGWIDQEVDRMTRTLGSVLDFVRGAEPSLAVFATGPFLAKIASRLEAEAGRHGISFKAEYSGAPARITADPVLLERVIENLVENAFKAVDRNSGCVRLVANFERDSFVITCSDNGRGIPRDKQEKIFEPFFSESTRGAGLGLHLARRVARDHGGSLEVESEKEMGTKFSLMIPMALRNSGSRDGRHHVAAG